VVSPGGRTGSGILLIPAALLLWLRRRSRIK
jgi:hypothetical protein